MSDDEIRGKIGATKLPTNDYSGHLHLFFDYLRNSTFVRGRNLTTLIGNASDQLSNPQELQSILNDINIILKKEPLQIVRNYSIGMYLEHFMMFKGVPNVSAQKIFIIACHYGGYLPAMFSPNVKEKLTSVIDLWKDGEQREQLFSLETDFGDIKFDDNRYYQILIELINFDFTKAKNDIPSWETTDYDNIKKASLMAFFGMRNEAVSTIRQSLRNIHNNQLNYISSLLYNICSDWDSRIRLTEFNDTKGYLEITRDIVEHSKISSEYFFEYGVNIHHFKLSKEDRPIQEGIKLLQLIIDTGLLPRYGLESIVVEKNGTPYSEIFIIWYQIYVILLVFFIMTVIFRKG